VYLNLPRLATERPELGGDYQRLLAAARENLMNIENKININRPASVISDLDEANSQPLQVQKIVFFAD